MQREERDRELTFQPRLVTTNYSVKAARRRVRAKEGKACLSRVGGEAREERASDVMDDPETRVQARFEMLYQDVRLGRRTFGDMWLGLR